MSKHLRDICYQAVFSRLAAYWNFCFKGSIYLTVLGYWHQRATLPQGNQELLVVRDKVGTPPGELG